MFVPSPAISLIANKPRSAQALEAAIQVFTMTSRSLDCELNNPLIEATLTSKYTQDCGNTS